MTVPQLVKILTPFHSP